MLEANAATDFVSEVLAGRAPVDFGPPGPDRDRRLELLGFHRLLGLWYSEVRRSASDEPGAKLEREVDDAVRDQYLRTGLHSTLVVESSRRAREALSRVGIPSIVFKGAALVQNGTYPEPAGRSLEDVDLLVPGRSADAAVRTLEASGFEPWVAWDERRIAWLPAFAFTDTRAPAGMGVTLDLHWRTPYTSFRSGSDGGPGMLWEGADLEAGLPAEEPHFVLLVEHFLKHLRVVAHVRAVGDLVRSLDRLSRPDLLASLAERRGSLRGLRMMLAFLRDGMAVSVPNEILAGVGVPETMPRAVSKVLNRSRVFGTAPPVVGGRFRGLRLHWAVVGSRWASLRDVYDVVLPPGSWLDHRYPEVSTGWGRRRVHHMKTVAAWLLGRGVSPLSPNQEFEA